MGTIMDPTLACVDIVPKDEFLLRGIPDETKNQVICQTGEIVHLSIKCEGKFRGLCRNADESCKELTKVYAYDLDLVRSSALETWYQEGTLNCYYEAAQDRRDILRKKFPTLHKVIKKTTL